jgi:hypothetical protein
VRPATVRSASIASFGNLRSGGPPVLPFTCGAATDAKKHPGDLFGAGEVAGLAHQDDDDASTVVEKHGPQAGFFPVLR